MNNSPQPSLPLVSVITPSYNQGRFIEKTIESVANQNYPRIEHIIVDGGSTDETLSILQKHSGRLFWISEPDKGQTDAINKGFRMAKGDILCWLNSDDTYEPGAIATAVDYLCSHTDVMMVYGEGNEIDENGSFIQRFPATQKFDLWSLIHIWDYILQPTTFFRRSVFDVLDPLDVSLKWCMDWDLWIRIGSHFKVHYVNYLFANSRIYPQTKTGSGGFKRFREIVSVMRRYGRRRYPLGYFIFWEDTVENVLARDLSLLFKALKRPLTWLRIKVDQKRATYQGVYGDQWLGKKACFMVPDCTEANGFVWEMEFPQNPLLFPNRLYIMYNGKRKFTQDIPHAGRYEVKIPVSDLAALPAEVIFLFRRSFVPLNEEREMVCYLHSFKPERRDESSLSV